MAKKSVGTNKKIEELKALVNKEYRKGNIVNKMLSLLEKL